MTEEILDNEENLTEEELVEQFKKEEEGSADDNEETTDAGAETDDKDNEEGEDKPDVGSVVEDTGAEGAAGEEVPAEAGTEESGTEKKAEEKPEEDDDTDIGPSQDTSVIRELEAPSKSQITVDQVVQAISIIDKKYDAGDFESDAEYRKQRDELVDFKHKLIADEREAKFIAEQNYAEGKRLWSQQQRDFFREYPDFDIKTNRSLYNALNGKVLELVNDSKYDDKDGWQILRIARKAVMRDLKIPETKKDEVAAKDIVTDTPQEEKPAKVELPKSKREKIPPTLGDTPSAVENPTSSWVEEIDALSGEKQEEAIRKLPPDKLDEYLRGN